MINYIVRSLHIGPETEHPNFHKVRFLLVLMMTDQCLMFCLCEEICQPKVLQGFRNRTGLGQGVVLNR